jgi:hypothetical protein
MKKLAKDKHSSLLLPFLNYARKSFTTTGPGKSLYLNIHRKKLLKSFGNANHDYFGSSFICEAQVVDC